MRKYKIGTIFYLKGTKQRFFIVDYDFGGNYYLVSQKDRQYAYLDYVQSKISERELESKYEVI